MSVSLRSVTSLAYRVAACAVAATLGVTAAAAQTQNPPFTPQPVCSAPPPPEADGWPVAVADALVSPGGAVSFTAASLLANDHGASALTVSDISQVSTNGGSIAGSDPFTYTAPAAFRGTDTFVYEIKDAAGHTTIGIVHVNVIDGVAVPNVVGQTQTAAQAAIVAAGLTVGGVTTANSVSVPSGSVISESPSAGTPVAPASAVSLVVSSGSAFAVPTVDRVISSDGNGKRTTAAFSVASPGDLLVAFAASDGPQAANGQSLTISGAGLTWTRVQRAATQSGDAEIWTARAAGPLTNVTVSSTQSVSAHQSLTVVAFSGVGGVGASGIGGAATGAPSMTLNATAAGSVVYAVGNDWDNAVARTLPAGQTKVHEFVDTAVGDTFWVQAAGAPIPSAGSVTLNATAPTGDKWNLAMVELTPGALAVSVSVPNVVGMPQSNAQSTIVAAGLTVGAVTSTSSASVPVGNVISQTPAAGGSVAAGTAVALVISLGPAPAGPTVDAAVSSDGTGARTTAPFSTAGPGEVLVAFAASDGPGTANSQSLTISGGGLTWTRVQRAATQAGVSEIWTATAPTALTNVTVTSTQSVATVGGVAVNQSLTVVAFSGASGVGASAIGGAATGAPGVSLVAQAAGSLVYGVGNDFDQAIARTIPAGQTKVHEFLASSGDTFWVQAANAATSAAGATVTLNATAPATDRWNLATVEIKR